MSFVVAHLADIHVRGLTRHDEIRDAVEAFCATAKKRGSDCVVIAGDVWHSKASGITPESVDLMSWMFRSIASVAPTYIVLGNHDGVLANASRQDAISPIVSALSDPRLRLCKRSGLYRLRDGVNLCVQSVFDADGWRAADPVVGEYNIGCYHGPVAGATTELGWALEGGVTVDSFAERGYDIVLLGDIHRQQYLAVRDVAGTQVPWIAYPGSLLQNTYAEDLEHGYLEWRIDAEAKTHSVEFVELPNPKPFVTVAWAGSAESTAAEAARWPDGSRYRIRSSYVLPTSDAAALSAVLRERKSATEVVFKADDEAPAARLATASAELDLSSSESIASMLKEYYDGEELTVSEWDSMLKTLEAVHGKVSSADDVERGTVWSLDRLEFDNLYGYGPDNGIDFGSMRGIVGVFGPNKIGKSSIVGSILYALFNSSDRDAGKNAHVVNTASKVGCAKAIFSAGGSRYEAKRTTTKVVSRGLLTANTALNVSNLDAGEDMTGDQRADTEKCLRRLLGSSEDFLMTCVSAQDDTFRFLKEGSTQRKAILSRFLGIDVFDRLQTAVGSELSERRSKLKSTPPRADLEAVIAATTARLSELAASAAARAAEREAVEARLRDDKVSIVSLKERVEARRAARSQREAVSAAASRAVELNAELRDLRGKTTAAEAALARSRAALAAAPTRDELDAWRDRIAEAKLSLERAKTARSDADAALQRAKRVVLKLADVPCGDAFPTCVYIKDAHAEKANIGLLERAVSSTSAALDAAASALDAVGAAAFKQADSARREAEATVSKDEATLHALSKRVSERERELESAMRRSDERDVSTDEGDDVEARYVAAERRAAASESAARELAAAERSDERESGRLEAELKNAETKLAVRTSLDAEVKTLELLSNAFSKRGIPNILLNKLLPAINAEISALLAPTMGFEVKLHASEDTNALEIFVHDAGGQPRLLELGSGMERMVASVAIRAALSRLTTLPKADFMVIDEGFGSLDDENAGACVELLKALRDRFRFVLVISHTDTIKDAVDSVVHVERRAEGASVRA